MSTTMTVNEIVRGWSEAEQKEALAELVRKLIGKRSSPLLIEDVGYLTPMSFKSGVVEFDDSTPYLREMRRRAETPEDSELIAEIDLPDLVEVEDDKD